MMDFEPDKGVITGGHLLVVVVLAIVSVLSAAWYLSTRGASSAENNTGIELGQTAPDFTLTNIDGVSFDLSDYRGNIVVIDLMATWCGPCVTEMGHLKQLHENYGGRGVMIMSIDVDPSESNEVIRQFKMNYGDNWIFASGSSVGTTYGVIYIPTLYIIDQQGRIAYKNISVTPYSTLATEIDKLL